MIQARAGAPLWFARLLQGEVLRLLGSTTFIPLLVRGCSIFGLGKSLAVGIIRNYLNFKKCLLCLSSFSWYHGASFRAVIVLDGDRLAHCTHVCKYLPWCAKQFVMTASILTKRYWTGCCGHGSFELTTIDKVWHMKMILYLVNIFFNSNTVLTGTRSPANGTTWLSIKGSIAPVIIPCSSIRFEFPEPSASIEAGIVYLLQKGGLGCMHRLWRLCKSKVLKGYMCLLHLLICCLSKDTLSKIALITYWHMLYLQIATAQAELDQCLKVCVPLLSCTKRISFPTPLWRVSARMILCMQGTSAEVQALSQLTSNLLWWHRMWKMQKNDLRCVGIFSWAGD